MLGNHSYDFCISVWSSNAYYLGGWYSFSRIDPFDYLEKTFDGSKFHLKIHCTLSRTLKQGFLLGIREYNQENFDSNN